MNLSSSALKNRAKIKLQGMYGQSLAVSLLYSMCISMLSSASTVFSFVSNGLPTLSGFFSAVQDGDWEALFSSDSTVGTRVFYISPFSSIGAIGLFIVAGPLMVGMANYFLRLTDRNHPQITDLFDHFKYFGNTVVLYLLTSLFTFLWTLLFFIPGIIAGISYAMAPYILAEHPEIKASDAIKMSKQMMRGNKGKYFVLELSFIGWFLLCCLTLGVGFLFLSPYIQTANAEFFNEVSGKNVEKMRAGVDPNGTGTCFGGAPAQPGPGYAQPNGDSNGYAGYAQPNGDSNGYAGYAQPETYQSYSGYPQTELPQDGGFAGPSAPNGFDDRQ